MYTVELYARVRRAVLVEGRSERGTAGLPAERTGEAAQAVAAAGRDRYHSGRRQDQTSETAAHGEANFRSCISKLGTDATSMKRALSMGGRLPGVIRADSGTLFKRMPKSRPATRLLSLSGLNTAETYHHRPAEFFSAIYCISQTSQLS